MKTENLHFSDDISDTMSAEASLRRRLAQQELMFTLSQSFISTASMDTLIPKALKMVGEFLHLDKAVLLRYDSAEKKLNASSYVWYSDARDGSHHVKISMPVLDGSPTHRSFIAGSEPYFVCNDTSLEPECSYAAGQGVKALLDIPIVVDGDYWGSLSFDECKYPREWSESDIQLSRLIGNVISGAISRNRKDEKLIWAMERAQESSRAKGDFLSRMSHEIRTPLNAIIGMTSIARSSGDVEKKDRCLEKIDDASVHLLGIINDILDMSKIEAKKFELSYTDFDFEAMLMRVSGVITVKSNEKHQTLIMRIDEELTHSVISDEQRLAQVITNLLSNAVKFTPEKGLITLDVRKADEANGMCLLTIEVADNGIGMSEEQHSRLFKSFEQADRNTSRNFGGTGLGLAICRSIVEMMGGSIKAKSSPGKGSTFTFSIRIKRGSMSLQPPAPVTGRRNLSILVVDESKDVLNYFTDFAERLEIGCTVATSLKGVGRCDADIAFVDLGILESHGFDIAGILADICGNPAVAAMGSEYEWSDVEDEAKYNGVKRFIPKPLFYSTIVDGINECLGAKRSDGNISKGHELLSDGAYAGKKILLAEDIEVNREIVTSMLECTEAEIDCAENGREACWMFEANPGRYDLILMDIHMPEMDGYEAAKRIRSAKVPQASIPIIAMTANVFREDIEKCLACGMNDHISKPINLEELASKLRAVLGG